MGINLCLCVPIRKGLYQTITVETDVPYSIGAILDIANRNSGKYLDEIMKRRLKYARSFKREPNYLKFFVMQIGQPSVQKNMKLGEFNFDPYTGEVNIIKHLR